MLNVFENGCCNGWLNGERPVQGKENDFGIPLFFYTHKLCLVYVSPTDFTCYLLSVSFL